MHCSSNPPLNRLLLALPADDLMGLVKDIEQVPCERGEVLIDADSALDYVFFPDRGVISVVAVYANGDIIEMATIGREGCTGFQAIFHAESSSVQRARRSDFWSKFPGARQGYRVGRSSEQWNRCPPSGT
jgi:hypothetical protein